MADFSTFRRKASETASYIADKSIEFAKTTAWRTKLFAKIAKQKSAIASEKDAIKKTYCKLGQAYYELFKDAPHERLQQFCEIIEMSENEIAKRMDAIDDLQAALKDGPEAEKEEAEVVVNMIEAHEEELESAEKIVEEAAQEISETVDEIKEAVEDNIEPATDTGKTEEE